MEMLKFTMEKHNYLGMNFDFSVPSKVTIDMVDYINDMVDDFSVNFKKNETTTSPATENVFKVDDSNDLDKKRAKEFHTFVAKGLFVCWRARPDIHLAIAALTTRVKKPNESDWKKLIHLLKYCNGTQDNKLTISIDNLHVFKWYVDSAFAVYPDFRSHTGSIMILGNGAIQSV